MNWDYFILVFVVNSSLCLFQYLIQEIDFLRKKIPPRNSIIPGTSQKFLYWQDFYNQTYGDFLGLIWIMNGFVQLVISGQISDTDWFIFIITAVISILIFLFINLQKNHKPDWGYPSEGKVSWGGLSHLPYFGLLFGMSVICLIKIINGEVKTLLLLTILGGFTIYAITTILDIKSGHFNPLRKLNQA